MHTTFNSRNPTYDEILTLLENIDAGNVEGYSETSIEEIRQFVVSLAQQGMLLNEYAANIELQNDILGLLHRRR